VNSKSGASTNRPASRPKLSSTPSSSHQRPRPAAKRINEIRRERGHDPLEIEVVSHVHADDGDIISSTRIVRGEIDEHGTLTPESDGRSQPSDE